MKNRMGTMLVAAVLMAGCASMRGVKVGTDKSEATSTSYRVAVSNTRSSSIVVSWVSGGGTTALGTVNAGATREFSVPTSSGSVKAITSSGTSLGTKSVTVGTSTKTVTF